MTPIPQSFEQTDRPDPRASRIQDVKRFIARSKLIVDTYRFLRSKTDRDIFKGYSDHLYHGPNFYLPKFPGRTVVTVTMTLGPDHAAVPSHANAFCILARKSKVRPGAPRASSPIPHYTRAEVLSHFGFPEEKVGVAQLACGSEFRPRTSEELAPVLNTYGLSANGYTLYTGTIEPRKNLVALINSYGRLPADLRRRYPLVLAGYKGWNNEAIMERIARAQGQGWLTYLGYVPNEHLPYLFSGARLFAFPSLYEGFGLPVLEAMASRVPVIASDQASLPGGRRRGGRLCRPRRYRGTDFSMRWSRINSTAAMNHAPQATM